MARVALLGHPDHKEHIIDMGRGWGEPHWNTPPDFFVMEYQPIDRARPRGRHHFVKVAYPFYRRMSDGLLVYKRPGYMVGSL